MVWFSTICKVEFSCASLLTSSLSSLSCFFSSSLCQTYHYTKRSVIAFRKLPKRRKIHRKNCFSRTIFIKFCVRTNKPLSLNLFLSFTLCSDCFFLQTIFFLFRFPYFFQFYSSEKPSNVNAIGIYSPPLFNSQFSILFWLKTISTVSYFAVLQILYSIRCCWSRCSSSFFCMSFSFSTRCFSSICFIFSSSSLASCCL